MSIGIGSEIVAPNQVINISSLFTIPASAGNPTYIDLTLLDRIEYPYGQVPILGSIVGNGHIVPDYQKFDPGFVGPVQTDVRDTGVVFTYDSASGRYYNATYGYFDQLSYIASNLQYDNTYFTIFYTSSATELAALQASPNLYVLDPESLAQLVTSSNGLLGVAATVDVITRNDLAPATLDSSTPFEICAAAQSFVGKVWNKEGCWVLASNITAQAGASLPCTSVEPTAPVANGEWLVAYYGGKFSNASISGAVSRLRPGDVVVTSWAQGGAHIFTIASGYGFQAQAIDNEQTGYNSANDGVASDIVIVPQHSAYDMLNYGGAVPASITIYRLDTPTVLPTDAGAGLITGQSVYVSSLFKTSDAGGAGTASITEYAIFDVGTGGAANDTFTLNGTVLSAHSGSAPLIVSSADLSHLTLNAAGSGTDTIYVAAANSHYWGDWVSVTLSSSDPSTLTSVSAGWYATAAPNSVVMGNGQGSVYFHYAASEYSIFVSSAGAVTVNDQVQYHDGCESLNNIQAIRFADTTLQTKWFTEAASLAATQPSSFTDLTELYIAYFNRAPDATGLDYWASATYEGNSLAAIAASFATAPETLAQYGNLPTSNSGTQVLTSFVTTVYENVLNRAPDSGGLQFWVSGLQSGALTASTFLLDIIYGTRAPTSGPGDALYLASKELVGAHFAITDGLTNGAQASAVMTAFNGWYPLGAAAAVAQANAVSDGYLAQTSVNHELVVQLVGVTS